MKARLNLVLGALRTFWWAIVLVVIVVLFGWIYLVNRKKGETVPNTRIMDSVVNLVKDAVTDVKVEHAIISTKSENERSEIEEVRNEPDGKKRRERLAAILSRSI